jgi:ADP-ribose pyrophosphatase YjhB (NUDIX family)
VALVILDADQVVCVRQPRRGASRPTLEVPQETLEPGETPREAAERGLAEECGLTARDWKELGAYLVVPA